MLLLMTNAALQFLLSLLSLLSLPFLPFLQWFYSFILAWLHLIFRPISEISGFCSVKKRSVKFTHRFALRFAQMEIKKRPSSIIVLSVLRDWRRNRQRCIVCIVYVVYVVYIVYIVYIVYVVRNSGIQEFWNSGIPEFRKCNILKAKSVFHFFLQN